MVAEGVAAVVGKTTLPSLQARAKDLQLDCANLTEAAQFVLAFHPA